MKELYKLLKEYDNKLLDKRFLYETFRIFIEKDLSLLKYVDDIEIDNNEQEDEFTGSKILGNYSIDDKLVTIYLNNILKNEMANSKNKKNILGMEIVKHELLHAENMKLIYERGYDIKSSIVKLSMLGYLNEIGRYNKNKSDIQRIRFLTKENYDINPMERRIEIEAWKFIVNLLKNQRTTDELLYARTNLYYAYIRGYKDNGIYLDCPTYDFLTALDLSREYRLLKNKVNKSNYNFNTRITNGLPIKYSEYNAKLLQKVKLQKRKRNN